MSFTIPLFDLNVDDREVEAIAETVRSKWISMGGKTKELEERFAARLGARNVIAAGSCTAALHLATVLSGLGEGDEVIVPSLTFVATVNVVKYTGATPVFADILGPNDLSIDPDDVRQKITPRTKAIIPMHFGGFPSRMTELSDIAREHDLLVIEDAAHTIDVDYEGRKLGTCGDIGCYSLFSNKVITSGEGGLFVTDDDDLADRARRMRSHGMTTLSYDRAKGHATAYDVLELGFNYRIDDIRASFALAQEAKLDGILERRAHLRDLYERELSRVDGIHVPYSGTGYRSANYIMPVLLTEGGFERREKVRQALAEQGIQTSVHYPASHRFSIYAGEHELPRTEFAADHEITLPMFDSLTEDQVIQVVDALRTSL